MDSASPIIPPNPPQKYRILVISADPEVCAAAKAAWDPSDEVLCVSDGQSGVTLFQQQTPGLVILDDTLPGEDVLKRFETLRTSNPDLPIIVVCSYPTVQTALRLMHETVRQRTSVQRDTQNRRSEDYGGEASSQL
jgi:DNA-binding NtrC family response regulator